MAGLAFEFPLFVNHQSCDGEGFFVFSASDIKACWPIPAHMVFNSAHNVKRSTLQNYFWNTKEEEKTHFAIWISNSFFIPYLLPFVLIR